MRSNVTVGPPIDLLAYNVDSFQITHQRRFLADDADLTKIRTRWEQALRHAVQRLPTIRFRVTPTEPTRPQDSEHESIELVDAAGSNEPHAEQVAQKQPKSIRTPGQGEEQR
jgi:hypothetical protein